MSDLSRRIANLSPDKLELLTQRIKKKERNVSPVQAIAQRSKTDGFPALSFAQERLWFLNELVPDNPAYNISKAVCFNGPVNIHVLEQSLNEIVRRHEALRTTIRTIDGQPVQVIAPTLSLSLSLVDLSRMDKAEKEARSLQLAVEDAKRPFDLAQGPLVRVSVLRLGEEENIVLFSMHHIISDGWSMGVLIREVAALYESFSAEKAPSLNELPIQYADFAIWQREYLQSDILEQQLSYWKRQLGGSLPALALPTDRPRPIVSSFRGASLPVSLSRTLTDSLKALSQREGVTLFMTLLAAYKVLLYRYTRQQDVIVGIPVANRNRGELEDLIGFFANTLVLRTDLSGDPSFRELLKRTQEVALGAYAHQDLPFEKVVIELQPERSTSYNPLFQVAFALQNAPMAKLEISGITLTPLEIDNETAKFDLMLNLMDSADGLNGSLVYSTDLFDSNTINRLAGHFQKLLEGIASNADQAISKLPLLTEAERRQLLVDNNSDAVDYSRDDCIHELFEREAERMPEAEAVVSGEERVSYEELNERANRLANYLIKLGVGAEQRVGICMRRSVEMVVGMLGVMKAGGAYVPLDPAYPAQRLGFMLEDAQASVLITQSSLLSLLPQQAARVVCLDEQWPEIAQHGKANPDHCARSNNLAYVIYTSGSTGIPKGVAITHSSAVAFLAWSAQVFDRQELSGVLASTSICFDLSVFEIFAPLSYGGKIILCENALELPHVEAREEVKLINTVPSAMAELVRQQAIPESVTTVNLAGEALQGKLVDRIYEQPSIKRVLNLYGPTEDTTYSTYAEVERERETEPSIGRAIAGTGVYILDEQGEVVPVGVAGELHLTGEGLARCYLNRAELTAEKFIPDAYSEEGGGRLYRTGDLARYTRRGEIEYLGRMDHQVKVRGFRIELGEIETAMMEVEGVREVAVIARAEQSGLNRIIAYVVSDGDVEGELNISRMRSELKRRLPDYMMPGGFVKMERLPLTPNGKLDRKALPEPEQGSQAGGGIYEGPRNPVEEIVGGIWAELLGVERVSINDNFFELGGHSLLATQVTSRLRQAFNLDVPVRTIFESPTIESLSEWLQLQLKAGNRSTAKPIVRALRDRKLRLSSAQQRLWFLDQMEPGSAFYNIAAALRLEGELSVEALEESINEVVRRHEALRTTFAQEEGEVVQRIAAEQVLKIEVEEVIAESEDEREAEARRRANEEARRGFDLERGPLVRVKVLRKSEREQIAVVSMHHIVSDGWSMNLLIKEMGELYEQNVGGKGAELEPISIQYADYAKWERERIESGEMEESVEYWKKQLCGAPEVVEIASSKRRPGVRTTRGGREVIEVEKGVTEAIRQMSRREEVTMFMTLLATFNTLLYRYTKQEDILIGTPIANRNRSEIEGLIGFFSNTLVLRTDLSGDPSFRELLNRTRQVTLQAYTHQDVPFEMLVEKMQPTRSLTHTPLFQVMFVLQNSPSQRLTLSGLNLEPIELNVETAKFDITLSMEDTDRGLIGSLEYNTDLFDQAIITQMLSHFQRLLEGIVNNADQAISKLPLLTEAERRQLLFDNNSDAVDYSRDDCIHELFEREVKRRPEAEAVVSGEERVSYEELNERANRLANYLIKRGVGPEVIVAMLMERTDEIVVGILAILKAGGAYLPLDPAYPAQRLAFMLEDAQASVLLTQHSMLELLPEIKSQVVCVDAEWDSISKEATDNPVSGVRADNLAYVIYTSGSTGKPKGTLVTHSNIVRLFNATDEWFRFNREDVWTLFHSYAFDFSVWELWGALIYGGRLVVVPYWVSRSPEAFYELLKSEGVTVLNQTPSAFRQLMQAEKDKGGAGDLSLRLVIFGGEALELQSLKPWYEVHSDEKPQLVNMYGITETTVHVTYRPLREEDLENAASSLIGIPIRDLQLYILDEHMEPVPTGVSGEIYVGGAGVARGYLNRPELTADRMLPDPFSKIEGMRLYRTGDLARYTSDADIEYLGRIDHQVKVRGFRIELGEIETAMMEVEGVREVAVIARAEQSGLNRVIAYVVSDEGVEGELNISRMRSELKRRLPDYMIPGGFVKMERLPLTPNGKLDRKALPEPEQGSQAGGGIYEGPRNPVEEIVGGIWAELLGVERVSIDDNFFELGGHSLLATQVTSRLRQAFNLDVPVRTIFESPTIESLSQWLQLQLKAGNRSTAKPIVRALRDRKLRLSSAQQRLWFLDQMEPGSAFYNIAAALRLEGELNVEALEESINEVVRRHEALRTTFAQEEGEVVQRIAAEQVLKIEVEEVRGASEEEREAEARRRANEEARRGFDLERGPLVRVKVLSKSEREQIAVVSMHHIVSDGWSMNLLIKEMGELYEQNVGGKGAELEPISIQYADYAKWERERIESGEIEESVEYWKKQLCGAPEVVEIASSKRRPGVRTTRGGREVIEVEKGVTEAIRQMSRREEVTMFMTLLAAFNTLIHYHTGASDIVVGTDVANRNRAATEKLIGCFTNQLVLRTDLSGNPSFRELLKRVRGISLGAYAHQDLPFDKLVEELNPKRDLSRTPLFQLKFVHQDAHSNVLNLTGLTLSPVGFKERMAKFDLLLETIESGEGLIVGVDYNTDLFDAATISQLLRHYEKLLDHVTAEPEARINVLMEVLAEADKQQLNAKEKELGATRLQKFKTIRRKAIDVTQLTE